MLSEDLFWESDKEDDYNDDDDEDDGTIHVKTIHSVSANAGAFLKNKLWSLPDHR
ncbi:hypothetical protein QJS10_CPB14g00587 [Acorus calamus]|uniref:Uncharacterized protein n=1 Tax=Acorus calamus TaxID=4465 RepID=A0AAV9D9Q2_ACOCL|nr:hypothetical protein QJS10_CPB14g00587 [Acorus calamus]